MTLCYLLIAISGITPLMMGISVGRQGGFLGVLFGALIGAVFGVATIALMETAHRKLAQPLPPEKGSASRRRAILEEFYVLLFYVGIVLCGVGAALLVKLLSERVNSLIV